MSSTVEMPIPTLNVGQVVIIKGNIPPSSNLFDINLVDLTTNEHYLSFRVDFGRKIVIRNSALQSDGGWGAPEIEGAFPFQKPMEFELAIFVEEQLFLVKVNGAAFCTYQHRAPYYYINGIRCSGELRTTSMEIRNVDSQRSGQIAHQGFRTPVPMRSVPDAFPSADPMFHTEFGHHHHQCVGMSPQVGCAHNHRNHGHHGMINHPHQTEMGHHCHANHGHHNHTDHGYHQPQFGSHQMIARGHYQPGMCGFQQMMLGSQQAMYGPHQGIYGSHQQIMSGRGPSPVFTTVAAPVTPALPPPENFPSFASLFTSGTGFVSPPAYGLPPVSKPVPNRQHKELW